MAISSVVLRQPSASRTSSPSLPQIINPANPMANIATLSKEMLGTRGAFASSYVVNHLKEDSGYSNSDDLGGYNCYVIIIIYTFCNVILF